MDKGKVIEFSNRPLMTPEHPRWKEFLARLDEALDASPEKGCPGDEGERPLARQVLRDMGKIDISASMEFFEAHGGRG